MQQAEGAGAKEGVNATEAKKKGGETLGVRTISRVDYLWLIWIATWYLSIWAEPFRMQFFYTGLFTLVLGIIEVIRTHSAKILKTVSEEIGEMTKKKKVDAAKKKATNDDKKKVPEK